MDLVEHLDKDITQAELEDLLRVASEPGKAPTEEKELSSIEQFTIALDIKPGDSKISCLRIWVAYNVWAQFPLGKDKFFKEFRYKFNIRYTRSGGYPGYHFDPKSFKHIPTTTIALNKILSDRKYQRYDSRLKKGHNQEAL